jgi:broad specificity phosphatase PhoE
MDSKQCKMDRRVVLLMRHGDSRQDHLKRYIGQTDTLLNERGRAQATQVHRELREIPFVNFYCSDLQRSLETARLIAGKGAAEVIPVPEFREISMGLWDGKPMEEVRSAFPDEYRRRGEDPALHAAPEGESFADLQRRVIPVFDTILREGEGPIVIVGHAGVNRVILCHLLEMPLANLFRLGQDYCCINVLLREKGSLRVHAINLGTISGYTAAFFN